MKQARTSRKAKALKSKEPERNVEAKNPHTHLLRLPLAPDDCRAYWENIDHDNRPEDVVKEAFEKRWFGNKSMERIVLLLSNFQKRFDAFPQALKVLCRWRPADMKVRRVLCHWHLQLADPIYRNFTGGFLVGRRKRPDPMTIDITARWLDDQFRGRWAASTLRRFARSLNLSASQAGLLGSNADTRELTYPLIDDNCLTYILYLLRDIRFQGTLLANPYLASVGLEGDYLVKRLKSLPDIEYFRMGELHDFQWKFEDLENWANNTVIGKTEIDR